MLSPQAYIKGIVQSLLPAIKPDSTDIDVGVRLRRYGDISTPHAGPNDIGYAEEGSYFTIATPTIGTGLVQVAVQTAFSSTAPNIFIFNGEPVGGKTIYPRFLKLITTAAATAAVSIQYAFVLDAYRAVTTNHMDWFASSGAAPASTVSAVQVAVSNRVSPLPANLLVALQDSATVSVIAAPSSQATTVARGCLGGLNIIGDELQINFGQYDAGANAATTAAEGAGQPGRRVSNEPVVSIPPQFCLVGHIWLPTSSASMAPELIMGLVAR